MKVLRFLKLEEDDSIINSSAIISWRSLLLIVPFVTSLVMYFAELPLIPNIKNKTAATIIPIKAMYRFFIYISLFSLIVKL